MDSSRRQFLGFSGAALLSSALPAHLAAQSDAGDTAPLQALLHRVLGPAATQINLTVKLSTEGERFEIAGTAGEIHITGTTKSATLAGVNWYLNYVVGVSASWNGDSLNRLPGTLPAPPTRIAIPAQVTHRFALNDTNDGYTGPYWPWERWERLIDILSLHGINEVLIYMGAEAVYQQTFRRFHATDEQLRAWFPTPAHQPWWLLQNMSSWVGPFMPQHLIDARIDLARRIAGRLRELGMTPVLPGYYGMVPDGFAVRNPGAHIVPQGEWLGMKRPDWLDPTCPLFPKVAAEFYRVQRQLFGPTTMFKMDPLHEGGSAGHVNITAAAAAIDTALQTAHPGANWAILGWQKNPTHTVLAGIRDKSRMLILDGQSDRFAYESREAQWGSIPYAFGTIWNFGGHTTMGANIGVWNERYFMQRDQAGSALRGIAVMPEASCNNPAAFDYFTELAWRKTAPDPQQWFAQWAARRYGGADAHASQAWQILQRTAYDEKAGQWSEAQDGLFSAQPNLDKTSAGNFSPKEQRYDMAVFAQAIQPLLRVAPELRKSSAYRYDLVDVARQTIANQSRVLLPRIKAAYTTGDRQQFSRLTKEWLERISALDRIVGTDPAFLLGAWSAEARAAGKTPEEQARFEFDAQCILLEWGPESSLPSGVADYANREWNGLLNFYRERWARYFAALETSLEQKQPPLQIDWFAMDQKWSRQNHGFPTKPVGDAYTVVREFQPLLECSV